MLALLATLATAATLAVLPFDEGSSPDTYDGLGHALAAMVTTDLTKVDGITVVERERLDVLLAELDLSTTEFIDKRTAQRLGSGLAADHVVTGVWSVVGDQLVVDARIVRVETGKVARSERASGPVLDFVSVEKQLIETLVADLDLTLSASQRRQLFITAPTESVDAFSAYGSGLVHNLQGEPDEARTAFEAALAADPQFAEARAAVEALGARVREVQAEREATKAKRREDAIGRVIDQTTDERTRPAGFRHSDPSLAEWALRLYALKKSEEHCVRYEEMRAYVVREGLPSGAPPKMQHAIVAKAIDLGLETKQNGWDTKPHYNYGHLTDGAMLFGRPDSYLWRVYGHIANPRALEKSEGMLSSAHACYEGIEEVTELEDLKSTLASDPGMTYVYAKDYSAFTVADAVAAHVAATRAWKLGADDSTAAEVERWLGKAPPDSPSAFHAGSTTAAIVRAGEAWVRDQEALRREAHEARIVERKRLGMSDEQRLGVTRAYAEENLDLLVVDTPLCEAAMQSKKRMATHRLEQLSDMEQDGEDTTRVMDDLWWIIASPRAAGCLKGTAATFNDVAAVYTFVDSVTLPEQPTKQCRDGTRTFAGYQNSGARMDAEAYPIPAAQNALATLDEFYRLVMLGCLEP